jgi:transposase-like protein
MKIVRKYFEGEARQNYWSVHVEAWRRSKLTKRKYCGDHGLSVHTFDRWMEHFMGKEAAKLRAELLREERRKKRLQNYLPVKRHWKNKAAQAFWAMHVEALIWSGMSAKAYAMSHNISPYSLKNWAHKIQEEGLEIDWRTHLHPSARSKISSGSSSAAKGDEANHGLTNTSTLEPEQDGRLNRRRFTEDEKRAIAEESATGKESAAEVCRRHGIVTSMLFRWRVQFGYSAGGKVRLVPVSLKSDGGSASTQPAILHDLIKAPDGMMTVDLGDGRRVFAPVGSDVDEVRRQATSAGGA